jgi:hypothetical protein
MTLRTITVFASLSLIAGCATVQQADLDAWDGQPVAALETHPVFLTIPVVKTTASDGTEIWNYVNGIDLGRCAGGGGVYRTQLDYASYNQFMSSL